MKKKKPLIILIAAMAANRVIGRNNTMPWHLPEDLAHFKKVTMGHVLVMGRKTFESIGKPLPGRKNVVISRNPGFVYPGVTLAASLEDALDQACHEQKIYIAGGGEIYRQALPFCHTLMLTVLEREVEGDTIFPEIDLSHFELLKKEYFTGSEPFTFFVYQRKGS